jgi:hypothetical protein
MIIINSGAYVTLELQAEFGKIPPCLLPLANRKLIEHQTAALYAAFPDESIFVTLPDKYLLTRHEQSLFDDLRVSIITSPEDFSLAAALLYTLNVTDPITHIRILHGDTLFADFPQELDIVSIEISYDNYMWEKQVTQGYFSDYVWTGFFSFSHVKELVRSLALCRDSFIDAVRTYENKYRISYKTIGKWYDLGHLNTYFRSHSEISTSRIFNYVNVNANILTKMSHQNLKIEAEYEWYRNLPVEFKRYTPQIIDSGEKDGLFYYRMEYLHLSPLNELFVHGKNPVFFWKYIFSLIKKFLSDACFTNGMEWNGMERSAKKLYEDKTKQRLHSFVIHEEICPENSMYFSGKRLPSLQYMCNDCIKRALALPIIPGVLHGDLCFSNIFVDLRAGMIKVIDPRGMDADYNKTIFGDLKYDVAKLAHSVIGFYDFIISGYYNLVVQDPYHYNLTFDINDRMKSIQNIFMGSDFFPGVSKMIDYIPITILLFLSMLPLHSDNHTRQQALFANALRLYNDFIMEK